MDPNQFQSYRLLPANNMNESSPNIQAIPNLDIINNRHSFDPITNQFYGIPQQTASHFGNSIDPSSGRNYVQANARDRSQM